jgi:ATP-binding cassette subfamily C protein
MNECQSRYLAAQSVGMQNLVKKLGGYDTVVGFAELSEGEKQLIVLARVFLSAASVVVLDVATSHLTPAHELLVEQAFVRSQGLSSSWRTAWKPPPGQTRSCC